MESTAPKFKVGDKVLFDRGMFGDWPGTVRKIYVGRGWRKWHEICAIVGFTRKNGSRGKARVRVSSLRPAPVDSPAGV